MKSIQIETQTAKRLIKNSQYIDKLPRNSVQSQRPPVDFAGSSAVVTVGTISASSGLRLGIGKGKLQKVTITRNTAGVPTSVQVSDLDGKTYPILNFTDRVIHSGALIRVSPCFGLFAFGDTSCSNVG